MSELADDTSALSGGYRRFFAAEWHVRFGQLRDRLGNGVAAEARYRKALTYRPGCLRALSGLGRLLLRNGRYHEAVEVWRRVVATSPTSVAMAFQFSRALHRAGEIDQAISQYLRVVTLAPAHDKACTALEELAARCLRADMGRTGTDGITQALQIGLQLLERQPDAQRCRDAALAIARTISAVGETLPAPTSDRALRYFEAALELAPDLVEAQRGAALCFERNGHLDKALAILDRQLAANPLLVEPQLHRDRILASMEVPTTAPVLSRETMLARARRLITSEPADPRERQAVLARARRLMAGEAADPQERQAVLARARRLMAGEAADPQEREAVLARARRLMAGEEADPQEREAVLARARRLMAGEAADPREREAVLARARRLMAGETSDPQEREAILAQARGLMTGETTDPQEREAILAQARRLLIGEPDVAVTLDPQERAAILAQARGLFTGDAATPEDRDVLLARAKRLLSGTSGDAAGSLDPMDRDALMAQARRLVSGAAAEADNAAADRKAMERLLRSAQAALTEGRLEEAAALYDEVLSLGDDPRALLGAAQVYRRQRRWGEAADVLTRLVVLQPRSVQSKRWLAQALLQDGQLAAAAAAYVDLSILQPDSSDVWQSLGQLQKRLGNWSGARVAWTRLIEIDPAAVGPRFELAWACHQAGDGDAARTQLQEILVRDPEHRPALTLLGRMTSATDPDDSLVCWGKLAALDPAAIEPHLQIARIHLRQQRLERAESSFRAVLDRDSRHAESMASIGRILAERDPEEAVRYFLRWTEQDNEAIGPWLAIAQMRSRARQADLAEAAYRRALEIDPLHQEALMRLGRLLTEGGQQEAALEVWSRLGELSPRQVEPKLQAGRILYARHDPRAEDALRAVLAIDPTNRQALRYLAQSLGRARGTIDAALEVWQQLADLDSDSVFPIAQRGRLFARLGRLADAEAEYRRALARDPHDPMALRDLARFYRVQLRWDDAADIYRTHLRVDPQRMDAILGLGQCLDRTNRLPEAKELYDRALSLEPDNITALGYRGRLLRTRGRVDDAIADFRRICELDPQNAGAWHELIFQLAGAEREPEALSALANAEKALGDGPETWMVLARAAAAALFEDQAIAYFERALAARPDSAEYRAQLGLHYARQGVVDGAFHHLLDSRDLAPRNVEVAKGLFDATRIIATLGLDHVALRRAGRTVGDILVPERLFHHVRRVADTAVEPYEPVPRRIVAISATLAPGGAERQLVNMLRGLSAPAYGLDLNLFCISLTSRLRRDFFLPVLDGTGVEVVSLDSSDVENCLWQPEVAPFAELIRHFPRDMVMPIAFWLQEFRRRRPQVVHAWQDSTNLTAVVAAVLAGVPRIVLCCRSVHPDNPRRRLRRFMNEAYRAVLDHPSVVMSNNSRAGADDYAEWLDMAPERIEVVYNGVDFDRLRSSPEEAEAARRQLGIPGGAPVLGGVFRMSEEKRPLLWLDVAAAVARQDETVHFVICGDGPMRDEMLKHAAALGIADRVHMPGAQSNIGSWYRLMGVVMLTSRHEGLPNVLLEAQSLGIPVVAPDVGGMSEVVEQGITGWTIRDADAESLAERVVHCLSNQDWRRLAVERAPVFVRERFGIPTMLRRNLEVYGIEQEPAVTR